MAETKSLVAVISIERGADGLRSILSDPRFDVLTFDPLPREFPRVIQFPKRDPLPVGLRYKLAFRYALDQNYNRVFPIHLDEYFDPNFLKHLINSYEGHTPTPEAVFGYRDVGWRPGGIAKYLGERFLNRLQNGMLSVRLSELLSGYLSIGTALLSRIPFERNSNDESFTSEFAVQCVLAQARLVQVPLPTARRHGRRTIGAVRYLWRAMRLFLHVKLMRLGFLYDRKLDLGDWNYPSKPSRWSSHSQIKARVRPGTRVLDIGCGRGVIADALDEIGCKVSGVDMIGRDEVSKTVSNYLQVDLNREPNRFFEWLQAQHFEYILMGDIIEHLVDPETFLERLRHSLPAGDPPTLLVSTGNVAFLVVRMMLFIGQFNYAPRGILDRTHTRLFTKHSFSRLFQQCGFEIGQRYWCPLPLSSIGKGKIARWLETLNYSIARIAPSAFAYQMIFEVKPLPTTTQLMNPTPSH